MGESNRKRPYLLGLGPFAHISQEDFAASGGFCSGKFNDGVDVEKPSFMSKPTFLLTPPNRSSDIWNAADAVDWSDKKLNRVTPVKNQGKCGSCWVFATAAVIESRVSMATGELVDFSTQELIDCAAPIVDMRGAGMLIHFGLDYVVKAGGLRKAAEYDGTCPVTSLGGLIPNYRQVEPDSEEALRQQVFKGPVAVALQADQLEMQLYMSGVLTTAFCQVTLNHAALLVGYGKDGPHAYWKVKNSWGTTWGEEGYARLCRNCQRNDESGQCGVTLQATYPLITSTAIRSPVLYDGPNDSTLASEAPSTLATPVTTTGQSFSIPSSEPIDPEDAGSAKARASS